MATPSSIPGTERRASSSWLIQWPEPAVVRPVRRSTAGIGMFVNQRTRIIGSRLAPGIARGGAAQAPTHRRTTS